MQIHRCIIVHGFPQTCLWHATLMVIWIGHPRLGGNLLSKQTAGCGNELKSVSTPGNACLWGCWLHTYMYVWTKQDVPSVLQLHSRWSCGVYFLTATLHSVPGTSGFFFICHQEWEKKDGKRSRGKVCPRAGLLKLIILPLPASCTLVAFASIWLQDKDLFRHKLLVTNCYYPRRVHAEDCAWFVHGIQSVLKGSTVTIVVILCHATFLFLLTFNSTTNSCHKGCFFFAIFFFLPEACSLSSCCHHQWRRSGMDLSWVTGFTGLASWNALYSTEVWQRVGTMWTLTWLSLTPSTLNIRWQDANRWLWGTDFCEECSIQARSMFCKERHKRMFFFQFFF